MATTPERHASSTSLLAALRPTADREQDPELSPRTELRRAAHAALLAVDPEQALARRRSEIERFAHDHRACGAPSVYALGKSAHSLVAELVAQLGPTQLRSGGALLAKGGVADADHKTALPDLLHLRGEHPRCGPRSLEASRAFLSRWCEDSGPRICLISGGSSALLAGPRPPLSEQGLLERLTELQARGLDIEDLNRARAELDPLKAGGLVRALQPSPPPLWVGVLRDTPAGTLDWVGSGPCTASGVELHELAGPETMLSALSDLYRGAPQLPPLVLPPMRGGARRWWARVQPLIRAAPEARLAVAIGECPGLVAGAALGPSSRGGRMSQLAAQIALEAPPGLRGLAAIATDGEDGPSGGAGVLALRKDLPSPTALRAALQRADTHSLWERQGCALPRCPSRTNVADLLLLAL